MLLRLNTSQVTKHWGFIAKHVLASLPVSLNSKIASLKKALTAGNAQVWVYIENKKIKAVMTTAVFYDMCFDVRRLNLYTISRVGSDPITPDEYSRGFDTLMQFAKDNDCVSIMAYTVNERVVDVAKNLGWKLEFCIYKNLE